MGILFDVPRIAEGNGFKQKGPTCWYYSAKMLVSLHKFREEAAFNSNWKSLHEVRKVICELSSESDLPDESSEDLVWLRSRLGSALNQHTTLLSSIDAVDTWPGQFGWYAVHEKLKRTTILKRTLGGRSEEKARREQAALKTASGHMENAVDTNRFNMLSQFLPGTFAHEEIEKSKVVSQWVENELRTNGPFYASGNVWSKSENRRQRVGGAGLNVADTRVIVNRLEADSAHAVVVVGISGNKLFYKDPNNSAELRTIDLDVFRTGWAFNQHCTLIRVICPEKNSTYSTKGGCKHTNAIIKMDH